VLDSEDMLEQKLGEAFGGVRISCFEIAPHVLDDVLDVDSETRIDPFDRFLQGLLGRVVAIDARQLLLQAGLEQLGGLVGIRAMPQREIERDRLDRLVVRRQRLDRDARSLCVAEGLFRDVARIDRARSQLGEYQIVIRVVIGNGDVIAFTVIMVFAGDDRDLVRAGLDRATDIVFFFLCVHGESSLIQGDGTS
jgi:hypothetical protein